MHSITARPRQYRRAVARSRADDPFRLAV